ncbi:Yhi9p [Sporobolomyces salmoneus]|uniref:Yhi9p n=1 Tax=Sporobolomyces salmoneus TaxID=183962 RepID=UPI003171B817
MPPLPFFTVDAFTRSPFSGNPAAVIVLPSSSDPTLDQPTSSTSSPPLEVDDALCLKLAAEFNLSETAFARPLEGGTEEEPKFELRWFTPTEEIPLCGHATLATAHIIFTHHHPRAQSISFQSRTRGTLIARRNAEDGSISLDFPSSSLVTLSEGHKRRGKVLEKVRKVVREEDVRRIDWADEIDGVVVEISGEIDLKGLEVDPALLSGIGSMVIFTQPAPRDSGFDIFSRVFAPDIGVPEDPATGAAHTALAPFWLSSPSLSRLPHSSTIKSTSTIRAKQVSKREGEMEIRYDKGLKRVELRGWARGMMSGVIEL